PRLLELAREDADAERDATAGHDEGSGSYVPAALLGLGILLMIGLGPLQALLSALRAGGGLVARFAGPRLGRLARHARRRALGFVARARTLARSGPRTLAGGPSE